MIHIGIDIHKSSSTFCALTDEGGIAKRGKIATSQEAFLELAKAGPRGEVRIAIETGNLTWWAVSVIRSASIEPLVVNARQFKLISQSRKKNDRHDALALADALRCGILDLCQVVAPSERAQRSRSLIRTRQTVLKQRQVSLHAMQGMLRSVCVEVKKRDLAKESAWERVLNKETIPIWMKPLLLTHRQVWLELSRRVEELDHMVRAELNDWPEAEILDEIPGFGPLVSLAVLGHLDDPHRFSRSAKVASYGGLVPSSHDSGGVQQRERITREGSSTLRHLMVQASWAALRSRRLTPALRKWAKILIVKKGWKVAVVALARRLLILAHRLWKNGEVYNPVYGAQGHQ
ncbi:MAG: IS110 family transposase [Deltaproteobacteria bacterium]|nr:IS110 family transposase [Deltaproteobacteria bacterium]